MGLVRVGVRMDAHRCWFLRKGWESERGWSHRACSTGTEIRTFFHPEEEFLLKLRSLEISGRLSPWLISIQGGKGWGGKGKNGFKGGL